MLHLSYLSAIFLIYLNFNCVSGIYEHNPFLSEHPIQNLHNTTKQTINQWQIALLGQPGNQGSVTPSPAAPGYIWIQVPIGQSGSSPSTNSPSMVTIPPNVPTSTLPPPTQPLLTKPPPTYVPVTQKPLPPAYVPTSGPAIQQPSPTTPHPGAIHTISVTPPTSDGDLNKKCLKPQGQFPSYSCSKYVNCWNGVAIEQSCPDGLLFSLKGYCDYPGNVDCQGRNNAGVPVTSPPYVTGLPIPSTTYDPTVTVTATPPVDPNLQRKCLQTRGQFPSDACNKYVNCWDGFVVEQECPEGLLFSSKGYCDYPQNVDCKNRTSDIKFTPDPDCPFATGTFRHKTNCSQYYTCVANKVVARYECQTGLTFSDKLGVCDYSYRVDCTKDPVYYGSKNYLPEIPSDFMDLVYGCNPGKVFRLNAECSVACICRDGTVEVIQCPNGLIYDSPTDKCLPADLARC